MREVLFSARYNAVVTGKLEDTKVLLKAMKPKTMVLSAHLQMVDGRTTRQVLQEVNPSVEFVVLDEKFAGQDPGESMQNLLGSLGAQKS